jgi:hypothetical protein
MIAAQAYFERSSLVPGDVRSSAESVRMATQAVTYLPVQGGQLGEFLQMVTAFVEGLLKSGGDRQVLPDLVWACETAMRELGQGGPGQTHATRSFVKLLHLLPGANDNDLLDELLEAKIAAWMLCTRVPIDAQFLRDAHLNVGNGLLERHRRRDDSEDLNRAIDQFRISATLGSTTSHPSPGTDGLFCLGLALRVRLNRDRNAYRDPQDQAADLDEAIGALRLAAARATRQDNQRLASGMLCELLVRRFHAAGTRADLDDAIAVYERYLRTGQGPRHEAPGSAAAEEAYRLRATIDNNSVDATLAFKIHLRRVNDEQGGPRICSGFCSASRTRRWPPSGGQGHTSTQTTNSRRK